MFCIVCPARRWIRCCSAGSTKFQWRRGSLSIGIRLHKHAHTRAAPLRPDLLVKLQLYEAVRVEGDMTTEECVQVIERLRGNWRKKEDLKNGYKASTYTEPSTDRHLWR